MKTNALIFQTISFISYVLIQVLLLQSPSFSLFSYAFCFLYVCVLLLMPFETDIMVLMLLGFGLGLCIDMFGDTLGQHTASCVLLAYLRKFVVSIIVPSGGYEASMKPTLAVMGFQWFAKYTLPLLFAHAFLLSILDASSFSLLGRAFGKAIAHTLFTFVVIVIVQMLFYSSRRRAQ